MALNPLQADEKLRQLLADVGSIQSGEAFSNWRSSFLKIYRNYLDPDGVLNARDADGRLITKLQSLAKVSLKVQSLTQNGNITQEQITADGRRALGKWTEEMQIAEQAVAKFCPKTSKDSDAVGYDKYELGAVLISDGFQVYEIMLTNRDFIHELRDGPLQGLLDRNALSILDFYARGMQVFVDVMSDLGLFKLMTTCVQVYQEEPRPNLADEPDILTEPVDRDVVVVDSSHGQDPDQVIKAPKGGKTKSVSKAGKSGKAPKADRKSRADPGEDEMPRKEKEEEQEQPPPPPSEGEGGEGEKIIYFDPKTGSIGLLLRDKCAAEDESGILFGKDDQGELKNNGVIESNGEKENLVWLLKKLEKQKPKEGAWLEEIKKEKAARKAAEGGGTPKRTSVRVTKEPVGGGATPSKPAAKKPVRKLSSTRKSGSIANSTGGSGFKNPLDMAPPPKKSDSSGFKNPLEMAPTPAKSDSTRRKSTVQDYQGMYKKVAPKPKEDGWEKVKPEEVKSDEAAQ